MHDSRMCFLRIEIYGGLRTAFTVLGGEIFPEVMLALEKYDDRKVFADDMPPGKMQSRMKARR